MRVKQKTGPDAHSELIFQENVRFDIYSKLVGLIICLLILFCPNVFARTNEIEQLITLPEEQIDVGIAALTLAKEIYPDIDIKSYSRQLDMLADKTRWLANDTPDPERRIRALNTVLFRQEGFHYDHSPLARHNPANYFLNGILDSKQGICYTMPLLYVAVAQRLGYPIYPVAAPDHIFARYADPHFREQNIEITSGGKYFPDDHYIKDFSAGNKGIESGSYMRTLTYKEFLGDMLAANAFYYGKNGKGSNVAWYLKQAIRMNPRDAGNYQNLAEFYMAMSRIHGKQSNLYLKMANEYAQKAKALGYVSEEDVEIARIRNRR